MDLLTNYRANPSLSTGLQTTESTNQVFLFPFSIIAPSKNSQLTTLQSNMQGVCSHKTGMQILISSLFSTTMPGVCTPKQDELQSKLCFRNQTS